MHIPQLPARDSVCLAKNIMCLPMKLNSTLEGRLGFV
jgi:hypothetical protein